MRTLAMLLACAWLVGCALLPRPVAAPSMAIPRSAADGLGALAQPCFDKPPGTSCFRALPMSAFAMDARLALARRAQHSIDVQYYLLQDDTTGRALLAELRDAATRGVRVRVLVDDLYTADSESLLRGLAAWPNVHVRLFNPFPGGRAFTFTRWIGAATDFARVNHRMHNKLFIVDGAFAIAGGRNIADEYFFKSDAGNFVDFDLLVSGAALPELQAAYDRYWNSTRVYPLAAFDDGRADPSQRRADFDARIAAATARFPALAPDAHDLLGQPAVGQELAHLPLTLQDGQIQVWCDDPEKVSGRSEAGDDPTTVTAHMLAAVHDARSSLLLVSPYFVPGTKGVAAIEDARRRGVEVSLLTNSMAANDEPFVSAAYARYREHLLKIGVDIAEISPHRLGRDRMLGPELGHSRGRMHAKLVVIDGRSTFVGSMNLDLRSSRENTELGLMIDSPILATQVAQLIEQLREIGTYRLRYDDDTRQVQWLEQSPEGVEIFDDEPGVDLFTRMKVRLLSPFIGEGLL